MLSAYRSHKRVASIFGRASAPVVAARGPATAAGKCSALSILTRGLSSVSPDPFTPTDTFIGRHMGSQGKDKEKMLAKLGFQSLEDLVSSTVPAHIRLDKKLSLDAPLTESEALAKLKGIMSKNKVLKSFIGMGYYETTTPPVILRNVLENPGWYTAYTPYQAEIAQGRLQVRIFHSSAHHHPRRRPSPSLSLLPRSPPPPSLFSRCSTSRRWSATSREWPCPMRRCWTRARRRRRP